MNRGEDNGRAVLTERHVREIRAAYRSGASQRELARDHGVCSSTICRAITRETWSHVEDAPARQMEAA